MFRVQDLEVQGLGSCKVRGVLQCLLFIKALAGLYTSVCRVSSLRPLDEYVR